MEIEQLKELYMHWRGIQSEDEQMEASSVQVGQYATAIEASGNSITGATVSKFQALDKTCDIIRVEMSQAREGELGCLQVGGA